MYKINLFFILAINFLYVFRSISVALRLENIIYFLTMLFVFYNMLIWLANLRKMRVNSITLLISFGLAILLYSFLINPVVVGIIGFAVLFLNLLFWDLFFRNTSKNKLDSFITLFLEANILFSIITALSGLYQYFIDASLMGIALHEIYGNAELMESGHFVKRVTGLMGSPQNYALYIGLMTGFLYYTIIAPNKKKLKKLALIILLVGGLVSGSRAYSVFIFQTILLTIFLNSSYAKNIRKIKNGLIITFILISIFVISNTSIENSTIDRMLKFLSDWPALHIYLEHLTSLDSTTFWLGKGIGVNERIVVNFLGHENYEIMVNNNYSNSYESYILSIFIQTGIVGLIIFLSIYIKALKNSYIIDKDKLYFSILISLFTNLLFTPSFNGFTLSFIIWPLILYPYFKTPNIELQRIGNM